ncbi:MAG: nuclear transport factor 2 family protein [Burkholderiaceae bacterium]|jgi:hypothetical protein|nr:nuclear transport factor 2 family protein [Burkholderiaceae bacterium]
MPIDVSDPRLLRLVAAYETLSRDNLPQLLSLYGEQAWFKDPFNEVRGRAAIGRIMAHMFDTLGAPRFVVHQGLVQGEQGFLAWEFHGLRSGGQPLCIRGASHLRFAADGRVDWHRDYWDAAEELYARLPLLGPLMRWLQRRLAAPQPPAAAFQDVAGP